MPRVGHPVGAPRLVRLHITVRGVFCITQAMTMVESKGIAGVLCVRVDDGRGIPRRERARSDRR